MVIWWEAMMINGLRSTIRPISYDLQNLSTSCRIVRNPQHDIAILRLDLDTDSGNFLYQAIDVSYSCQKWGYGTSELLLGLTRMILDKFRLTPKDELTESILSVAAGTIPLREIGSERGVDIERLYGTNCKRHNCWFVQTPITVFSTVPRCLLVRPLH